MARKNEQGVGEIQNLFSEVSPDRDHTSAQTQPGLAVPGGPAESPHQQHSPQDSHTSDAARAVPRNHTPPTSSDTPAAGPSVAATSSENTDEDIKVENLRERLKFARASGRAPLFVLGAGISADQVPLLWQIGAWFNSRLLGKPNENGSLPQLVQSLASGVASRAQAAELFSTLQAAQNSDDWQKFSRGFLNGDKFGDRVFPGLLNAKPSRAHQYLARQLAFRKAYVISLNFDGLTVNALLDLNESKHKGVALHSQQQVTAYFTATRGEFLPAVIKARGDVFYARCADPLCPASNEDHPLDRQGTSSELRCSACRQEKLRLQFSFPGFREKEEAARGILCEAMRFLAQRLSGIIILGLSGRWDSYLLDFVFHHAVQRGLVVADVKPNDEKNQDDALIQSFRSIYYPSCRELTADPPTDEAAFVRIRMDADHFCEKLDDL